MNRLFKVLSIFEKVIFTVVIGFFVLFTIFTFSEHSLAYWRRYFIQ